MGDPLPLLDRMPADTFGLYQSPKVSYISLPPNTTVVLAAQDVNRVFLACTAQNTFQISWDSQLSATNPGLSITANAAPFILSYWLYGIIVANTLYAFSGAGTTVTLMTHSLREGISLSDDPIAMLTRPQPKPPRPRITQAPGVNGGRGILDYWNRITAVLRGKGF